MSTQAAFDPVAFKTTTRRQWQEAADAWHRWGGFIGGWLGEATEAMIEMAGIDRGHRVVDVAAGAGEQSLRIARAGRAAGTGARDGHRARPARPGRGGRRGRGAGPGRDARARRRGPRHARARQLRRRRQPGRPHLLPRPAARAARALSALRPGGRIGAVVYSTPDANAFFSIPVGIIRARAAAPAAAAGPAGSVLPGRPGCPGRSARGGGVRGRRGARRAVARRAPVGAGVRAVPAGVVRRAAPDDGGADARTSGRRPGARWRPR